MDGNTQNIDIKPGQLIAFKRVQGRGRPVAAKALAVGEDSLMVILNDGVLEKLRLSEVHKIATRRGRPSLTPLETLAAAGFHSQNEELVPA